MKNTRFMEVMFSNTDEELAKQVDSDIRKAAKDGSVDTEEVRYDKTADGNVAITDKDNGEVTIAEKDPEEADTYNLIAVPDEQLERFVHPSAEGLPGHQLGAPDENVEDHFEEGCVIAPNMPDGGLNPEAGSERKVEDLEPMEYREFSVTSDNDAWQKIFSMPQEFCEYLFSEVIESSETSKVGDLKIEKCVDEPHSVVVTSESTGKQVKITLSADEMQVEELDTKGYSGNYMPLFIIGINPYDHYIVDAQEYGLTRAQELKAQLEEDGIEAIQIFDNQEEARDYAFTLLGSVGADPEEGDVEEPVEQKEYSDSIGASSVYTHSYSTDNTVVMTRMYSESELGISDTQDAVNEAIDKGEPVEIDGAVITPVDHETALIEDGKESTKAVKSGDGLILEGVDDEEVEDLKEESDRNFSEEIYSDEFETKFFSDREEMTDYMIRLFSEESSQDLIEEAIANGEELENESETITPVDATTAVVEDKENGEFTKVTILDEDKMNVHPISDEEAEDLVKEVAVDDDSEEVVDDDSEEEDEEEVNDSDSEDDDDSEEDEEEDDDDDEKEFSDIYSNPEETKFFSEDEEMTDYMIRLYSDEADQDDIEEALESGEQIENDDEVITPVDATTAVVEDKSSGEFSKAELNDDTINVESISEEEADDLTENLQVEKSKEDLEEEEEEKKYSVLDKFFAEAVAPLQQAAAPAGQPVAVDPNQPQVQNVVNPNQPVMMEDLQQPSVEDIEDKALAAVQSIKAAAEEATAQIMEAKATPAPEATPEIQEAQFSEKTFSQRSQDNTLVSWLQYK